MEEKYKNYINSLGIFFILISLILIVYTSMDLLSFLDISNLFEKFGIDSSSAIKSQTIFFIIKYLIAISFFVFAILLIKHKEIGRLGFIVTILISIFFLLFYPLIFSSRLEGPMMNFDPNTVDKTPAPLPFAVAILSSIGLILVFIFLLKEKTKKIFKSTT